MQTIDVVHDQPAGAQSQKSADDADGHAIAKENRSDAAAGCSDAFDDADVAGLLDHDHVEDAENQEDRDDADEAEEDGDEAFFLFDRVDEIFMDFLPGLHFDGIRIPRHLRTGWGAAVLYIHHNLFDFFSAKFQIDTGFEGNLNVAGAGGMIVGAVHAQLALKSVEGE